jgi:hypothetical protein
MRIGKLSKLTSCWKKVVPKKKMKLTPVHCCIICREVPKIVRRRLLLAFQRDPLKQLAHDEK